jgi:hypothetical protein
LLRVKIKRFGQKRDKDRGKIIGFILLHNYMKKSKSDKVKECRKRNEEHYKEYRHVYFRTPKRRWILGRSLAKSRNLLWDIPLADYERLISSDCHYCGGTLEETGVGLDRKDNAGGYIVDNVVPCCHSCNTMKTNKLTYEEMVVVMNALLQYQKIKAT